MEYNSPEARKQAKETLERLMKEHDDTDKANWLHCGSLESAKFLGLQSIHSIKTLEHVRFGDFVDMKSRVYYRRITDTRAGRIYHKEDL